MTDREASDRNLLELAAKAAGIIVTRCRLDDPACRDMLIAASVRNPGQKFGQWNPLTDDGDALRLAVKLRLNVQHYVRSTGVMCVQAVIDWGLCNDAFHEEHGDNPEAATRRAIVRAAAELGKQMA